VAGVTQTAHEPYVGLRHYEADDRDRFFGRTLESRTLFEEWQRTPLTILSGPAGIGKTSLINAAVVPMVQIAAGPDVVVLPPWSPDGAQNGNRPASASAFLRRLRLAGRGAAHRIYAVIDQVEHALRDAAAAPYKERFLDQLATAVREIPGLHLLVSIRDDAVHELAPLEAVTDSPGRCVLGALAPDAALAAVAGPAAATRRTYADGAAAEVVRNLRTSRLVDVLGGTRDVVGDTVQPVQLQAACSALWATLPDSIEVVTREHLYSPGDLDGGLVRFCERAVREVAAEQDLTEPDLWVWLVNAFVTDSGGRGAAYEGVRGVAGMPREVASGLVDRYVLSTERRLGSRWYHLTNDRLLAPLREAAGRWAHEPVAPADPAASLAAAELALAASELARAAQFAAEAVRTSGDDLRTKAGALSCLGQVATTTGRDQDAEPYFRQAATFFELMRDPAGSGRSLAGLGRSLLRRGRYAEAVSELQGAEVRLPSDLAIQIDLARALRDSGQLWAATAVLGAALTIAPGTVDALVERGLIRIRTGEFSSALDDLDNAVRMRPSVEAEVRSARDLARDRLRSSA
jgi:tetratricopeptide (TPR) repeat protein